MRSARESRQILERVVNEGLKGTWKKYSGITLQGNLDDSVRNAIYF